MAVPTRTESMSTTNIGPRRAAAAADVLPMPGTKDFVLLASPSEYDMIEGEALPRLIMFPIEGGLMGVPASESGDFSWRGAVQHECERFGRVLIDPEVQGLELVAFAAKVGKSHPDDDAADPRSWYVRRYKARRGMVHTKPWQRPRKLGNTVVWDRDIEGEREFRRQVRDKVLGGIDPQIEHTVRLEAERLAAQLEAEARTRPTIARNAEVAKRAVTKKKGASKAKA
ncbi:hypothetical protein H8E07_13510 [bacterium]|nr:hypothetical protein [bacterium]